MSCNFCQHIHKQGMSQYCRKIGGKEIIYDQSTNCPHYEAKDDAPTWGKRPKANDSIASTCSLDRWPTVEEVRANYLREGYPLAHALVEGFSDYHPTVVAFSIGGDIHRRLVCACFYDRMSVFVRELSQQSGIRLTWLAIPANANVDLPDTAAQDSASKSNSPAVSG